jgi:hypothetical protein
MAGYSATPLPQKLGIKSSAHVVLVDAPANFEAELQPLPEGVVLSSEVHGQADVILAFYTRRPTFDAAFKGLAAALQPAGGLWIAWPKKSSGVPTDLNENLIRETGLAAGLVDNKVCAVTDVWSGLRFVYRLKDRPKH